MSRTPLPSALAVRELLEGLLSRDVEVKTGAAMVNPTQHPGGVIGVYVDDRLQLRALIVFDAALAARVGAAIGLVPAGTANAAVEDGLVPPVLFENSAEILNVAASLFNPDGAPHLRLYQTYAPRETLPNDVAKWVLAYVPRLDMDLIVAGYGAGNISVIVP